MMHSVVLENGDVIRSIDAPVVVMRSFPMPHLVRVTVIDEETGIKVAKVVGPYRAITTMFLAGEVD